MARPSTKANTVGSHLKWSNNLCKASCFRIWSCTYIKNRHSAQTPQINALHRNVLLKVNYIRGMSRSTITLFSYLNVLFGLHCIVITKYTCCHSFKSRRAKDKWNVEGSSDYMANFLSSHNVMGHWEIDWLKPRQKNKKEMEMNKWRGVVRQKLKGRWKDWSIKENSSKCDQIETSQAAIHKS